MIGPTGSLVAVVVVMALVVIPATVRLVDRLVDEEPHTGRKGPPPPRLGSMGERAAVWVFLGALLIFGLSRPRLLRPYGLIFLIMVEAGLVIGLFRTLWRRWRGRRKAAG